MRGDGHTPKSSPASLIPVAVVAIGVLVLALVVSAGRTGAIVVERITMSFTTSARGKTIHPRSLYVTTINETSAGGVEQRSLTSSSFTRPGFEQAFAGDTLQLYDPADNTVYVTTERGQQEAIVRQVRSTAPRGAHVGAGNVQLVSASANSIGYVPGRTSVYERWLRDGSYRLAGHATVDGRAAVELVQAAPARGPHGPDTAGFESTATVYVAPGSYEPIETIERTKFPGIRTISITRWTEFRVLPATAANQRLLSLTAGHPHARVVHNSLAFVRASQSEPRASSLPGITVHSG